MRYLHSMIRVGDLDAALDFFCNKLGLVEVRRTDNEAGRFSLIFLVAPDDLDASRAHRGPEVELTHNWDEKEYGGGRNFGHLAYQVDDIYAACARLKDKGVDHQSPAARWAHGVRALARWNFDRAVAERRGARAC